METLPEDIKEHAIEIGNDNETGITIEKSTSKTNIILDMSKFDLFSLCHFRYYMRYVLSKAPTKKAEALDRGGLMHEGFDVYYSMLQSNTGHFNDRVHAAVMKIRELSCDSETSDLPIEDVEFLVKTVEQNLEFWRFEDEQLDIILVEQPFAHVVYEDDYVRIILSGKIDILCNYRIAGGRSEYLNLPIDHKSYSRDSELLRLSNQFMCYSSAVGSDYLLVNRVGLQKSLKPEEKFKRVPLSYDKEILEEWKQNVIETILEEYLNCIATGKWRQNFTSCQKFNRTCEYYQVCDTSGKEAKMFKLNSDYGTASPWDVTAKLIKG